ncbi:hypothetical protein DPMN_140548 [Dreissena polymorpha]|uniref:NACHT domain-containing protein n=1 Tax=Dreissena polymorpha TaxID=45954 RepID=A0A9D4G7T4_DREPO|nr:hypothetical protein DPMN_140548 [Dreissena polymorpha]
MITSTTKLCVQELEAQTLRGKDNIESSIIDGSNTITSTTKVCVQELEAQTLRGKDKIESVIIDGRNTITSTTKVCVQELEAQTLREKDTIESSIIEGSNTITSTTKVCVQELEAQTHRGNDNIESVIIDGSNTITSTTKVCVQELEAQTLRGKDTIESSIIDGSNTITSTTKVCVQELGAQTLRGKDTIESSIIDGSNTITSTTKVCVQELEAQTLRGNDNIESVIIDGSNTIASTTKVCVQELEAQTLRGKDTIESVIIDGSSTITSTTKVCVQELEAQTLKGNDNIESVIIDGSNTITSTTKVCVQELKAQTLRGKDNIESVIIDGSNTITSTTKVCVQELEAQTLRGNDNIETVIIDGSNTITSTTKVCVQELEAQTLRGKDTIESVIIDGSSTITSTTKVCVQELKAQTIRGYDNIESVIIDGSNTITSTTKVCVQKLEAQKDDIRAGLETVKEELVAQAKREVRNFKTNGDEVDYSQRKVMLLDMIIKHYDKTLSTMTTSPLHDGVHARVDDMYMPPKLQLMEKFKGAFKKTDTTMTSYSRVFLKDGKYNQNMFIQGEAGSGKSTFLAILVIDWCSINSKTSGKQFETVEHYTADANARLRPSDFFDDLKTLKEYTFVFHITLRDSVNELNILEMLKKQIIDSIYGDKDKRKNAYRLLNEIMERERCLILLDGLDEWTCNEGRSLPVLAASHIQCDVLITTRPWKLTEAMIPDAKIDMLLQLEGVNEPFEVSRRLLGCMDECKDSMMLEKKQSEFESYIMKNDLEKFLISPVLLQLIVHSWVEGTVVNGSMCEIYSLFLESLLKKANKKKKKFQSPPVQCFKDTEHIQPNIENVDRLAKAAFHLLFSNTRESSLVFSDTDLERFGYDEEQKEFAFKSGILSATRNSSALRSSSSFSFIHKSIQEFLTAYYIACNTHLIDDIINGYLNRYTDAYMDISQVFIFLCGMEISAADNLSSMMDKRDVDSSNYDFPRIILSGYREAVANKHYDSNLKLSHFKFDIPVTEIGDVNNIWIQNRSNILSVWLVIRGSQSSYERGESASHYEFDLSSCSKLKSLTLHGEDIWLKDSSCLPMSKHPVWIFLNSADPLPAIPCIERIRMQDLTCSSRVLRSLLSSLLTLDHEVTCRLICCSITSSVQSSDRDTKADMKVLNNTLEMVLWKDSPGLWEALHSLNIKSLILERLLGVPMRVKHKELLPQSLSSLEQLETDSQYLESRLGVPVQVKHEDMLSQSLSSLTQLETLTIYLHEYVIIKLPPSLKYLNIYFYTLLPTQIRELMDTLRACTQTIDSRLEFGCAMSNNDDDDDDEDLKQHIEPEDIIQKLKEDIIQKIEENMEKMECNYADVNHPNKRNTRIRKIAPERYIPIVRELETLENVAVNRFQILDRTRANTYNVTCWSARSNRNIDDYKQNGDNFEDKLYTRFVQCLDNKIKHRISMRTLINPASTSRLSNQYGCNRRFLCDVTRGVFLY